MPSTAQAKPNYIALFGVQQNTPKLDAQLKLYSDIGYAIDDGAQLVEGETLPDVWFSSRGIKRDDLNEFVAMRLPGDAYMHVFFYSWKNLITENQWPAPYNLIGSRGMTFMFDDVEKELARIKEDFPGTKVLMEPTKIKRRWGMTTHCLFLDPEDLWVELISIEGNPQERFARPPKPHERSLLHFQVNCMHYPETSKFYRAFGMEHDSGVDYRPDVGFPDGIEYMAKQMKDAFGFVIEDKILGVDFLRGTRDPSLNHLELLETIDNGRLLKDPGLDPTWSQKGIARYCMKTARHDKALDECKRRGNKIYVEDMRGCLNWGDSVWTFFGDEDGNILTLEEWLPHRYWGERT